MKAAPRWWPSLISNNILSGASTPDCARKKMHAITTSSKRRSVECQPALHHDVFDVLIQLLGEEPLVHVCAEEKHVVVQPTPVPVRACMRIIGRYAHSDDS
jgi:hypothetical protein